MGHNAFKLNQTKDALVSPLAGHVSDEPNVCVLQTGAAGEDRGSAVSTGAAKGQRR